MFPRYSKGAAHGKYLIALRSSAGRTDIPKAPISLCLIHEHANIQNENTCVLLESSQLDRILRVEDLYRHVQARTWKLSLDTKH